MDTEQARYLRAHAWTYYHFHTEQRMKNLRFFSATGVFLCIGLIMLVRAQESAWIISPSGILLAAFCLLFWRLDEHSRMLINQAEEALQFLDAKHELACLPGVPPALRFFEQSDKRMGFFGKLQPIRCAYGILACLGLFFSTVPAFRPKLTANTETAGANNAKSPLPGQPALSVPNLGFQPTLQRPNFPTSATPPREFRPIKRPSGSGFTMPAASAVPGRPSIESPTHLLPATQEAQRPNQASAD